MKSFKSIGIETELFLTRCDGIKTTVFNASKELEKLLGFNINPVGFWADKKAFLQISDNSTLTTDGTPVEYATHWECSNSPHVTEYYLKKHLDEINKVNSSLLRGYTIDWGCFAKASNFVIFDSPNNIYATQKLMRNAYTGQEFTVDKKEENKAVTVRTAGLHLHFELKNHDIHSPRITDEIIKLIDTIYYSYYAMGEESYARSQRDLSQIKGNYRIKEHNRRLKTLEYRQLIPSMLKNNQLFGFLCHIDNEINKIKD